MSIENTIEALNGVLLASQLIPTVVRGETGAAVVPKIDTASLPAAMVFPEGGQRQQYAFRPSFRETRAYSIRVYLSPVGEKTINIRFRRSLALLQELLTQFDQNRVLAPGLTVIGDIADSGIISGKNIMTRDFDKMLLAGVAYVGFALTVNVLEIGIYSDGEHRASD